MYQVIPGNVCVGLVSPVKECNLPAKMALARDIIFQYHSVTNRNISPRRHKRYWLSPGMQISPIIHIM